MNADPDFSQENLLAWLLQESDSIASLPAREGYNPATSLGNSLYGAMPTSTEVASVADRQIDDLELNGFELFDAEEIGLLPNRSHQPELFSPHSGHQIFNLGEIPTVYDRFHTLLKRRLQAEIELHPPVFPWETEVNDYETDLPTSAVDESLRQPIWLAQLRNLNLPVQVPERVLVQLLEQCEQVLQSSLRDGAKLVQLVESLFPGETQTLNQLASLVLMSPARSGSIEPLVRDRFPENYEAASSVQQMLLSLLAARELVNSLTLSVPANQLGLERQWVTAIGSFSLKLQYQLGDVTKVRAEAILPNEGSLKLKAETAQAIAQRSNSGCLSVELFDVLPHQACTLAVQLQGADSNSLIFQVNLME